MDIKKVKLKDVTKYSNKKIEIEKISVNTYISTENMLPYRSGIGIASSLPNQKTVTLVEKNNVLISNIRPYFKKIWFSNFNGGCSNDVLNIQVIDPNIILPEFLYYTLMSDNFFDYVMSSVKGTKMPRGDKDQIMNYELELPNLKKQHNIVEYLSNLDKKIELNNQTNDNLLLSTA
jgi:type I restriction enzyme S subunit